MKLLENGNLQVNFSAAIPSKIVFAVYLLLFILIIFIISKLILKKKFKKEKQEYSNYINNLSVGIISGLVVFVLSELKYYQVNLNNVLLVSLLSLILIYIGAHIYIKRYKK